MSTTVLHLWPLKCGCLNAMRGYLEQGRIASWFLGQALAIRFSPAGKLHAGRRSDFS